LIDYPLAEKEKPVGASAATVFLRGVKHDLRPEYAADILCRNACFLLFF
jgi:hypothetical protein